MNFEDRYNSIIAFIEENLHLKADEIIQRLSDDLRINKRVLGEGFQFVTGLSINEYVRNRRVVNGMKYKLATGCSLDMVAEEFGFSDQPTFSKACKEAIKMSPSQVSNEELEKLPPLWLEELADAETGVGMLPRKKYDRMSAFGTTRVQFSEIRRFVEMNSMYGFDDDYLELTYQIREAYNLDMKAAFDFVEEIVISQKRPLDVDVEKWCWEYAFMHFKYGLNEVEAARKIEDMHASGERNITKVDESFLAVYLGRYAEKHDLSWEVIVSVLTLMRHQAISFDEFGAVVDKAALLFDGDVLAALSCPITVDECLEHIRGYGDFPAGVWEKLRWGIVSLKLKQATEGEGWNEWYWISDMLKEQ